MADPRYWVAPSGSIFDNTDSWSLTSGGAGGASIPGINETVHFDSSGIGTCTITNPVNITALTLEQGFNGNIQQNDSLSVSGDASFCDGYFLGGASSIDITGSLHICGTEFRSTSGTMQVVGEFSYEQDQSGAIIPQQIVIEELTLTMNNVNDKFVTMSDFPDDETNVSLNVIGGGSQIYGTDYVVSSNELSWAGLGLDGDVTSGDVFRIMYENAGPRYPGYFFHNSGTVQLHYSATPFSGGGIELYDLILSDGTQYRKIDSSSFIRSNMVLDEGYLVQGTDATMHLEGDMTALGSFGQYGMGTGVEFRFDGSAQQMMFNTPGAILPTIVCDKQTSYALNCSGAGPVQIDGDLTVLDGTFNTNGLSAFIGEKSL